AGIVVPICGQWAWNGGWLQRIGFFDAAGSAVLHVTGGAAALAAAIIAGPRSGKYNRDGSSNLIPGHSIPMASVGVLLMLAGWVPYMLAAGYEHGGLSRAAMNTVLSASAGTILAVIISNVRYGKPYAIRHYGALR